MEHVCSSKEDEYLLINSNKEKGHEVLNSSYEEEPPLFLDFPSPFFDEISTKPLSNTITDQPSSESNRLKKRSVGKKDRHSKIHTARGLRDRRMRLSLHIARKFFDLQDLLGFDKASKTIEWLFCKSRKAIKEVAENLNPQQHTNQQISLMSQEMEIKAATCRKLEIKKRESIRKRNLNNSRETRDQARARARDRTRERLMIKELEKQLFEGNPKDEIYKLGIGYSASPNNHIVEEGSTSSPSQPIQLEHSTCTHHHLLQELQLANKSIDGFENDSGNNIPADWQSSIDGFLGVPGEWDANNFITDSCNYGMVPTLTGDIYEQNPSSIFMSITTNILHF